MINFRFHLVSLVAVFLALAGGIAIGAAVVDRATIDLLENQLDRAEARRVETNARNDDLQRDVTLWGDFAEQAEEQLVPTRLTGTRVLFVAVKGIDEQPLTKLQESVVAAGATVQGTLWLTGKWRLETAGQTADLASSIGGASDERPEALRDRAISRLASVLSSGEGRALLAALESRAFLDFEAGPGAATLADVTFGALRYVFVSGPDANLEPSVVLLPLVQQLAETNVPLLVGQTGRPKPNVAGEQPQPQPETIVGLVRSDSGLRAKISTVDDLGDYRGRTAAILVLARLGGVRRPAHPGLGPGSDGVLPTP